MVTLLEVSAASYAQQVSVNFKRTPVKEVLNELTRQTGYNFICDPAIINKSAPVTIKANKATLHNVLNLCFDNLSVEIVYGDDNTVVIKQKKPPVITTAEQQVRITGRVTDPKKQTLPGVTVKVKENQMVTTTNRDGDFTIDAQPNNTLIFSFIGYVTQEVVIGNRTTVDVVLEEQTTSLNDVVVVGYATQKKVSLTSAVSVIKADDIARRPVTNTIQAFQGLSPGFTILDKGGAPGRANVTARIRGITTLSGNNPLILVDNLEQAINNINPDDIESVSILKDAAATSIYGSRAATGVILITTKRAKNGPVTANFNSYVGIQQLANHPNSINTVDYLKQQNAAYVNAGRAPFYSDDLIAAYSSDAAKDRIKYPLANDWFNQVFSNALQHNENFSVSGGSDKFKGLVNIRNFQQNGIIKNVSANVQEVRINTDLIASSKFNFNFDGNYRKNYSTQPQDIDNVYFNTLHNSQLTVPRYPDGSYGLSAQGNNPLSSAEQSGYNKDYFDNISFNLRGNWNIVKGLSFNTQYGVTSTFDRQKIFTASYSFTDQNNPSRTKIRTLNSLTENRADTYLETINSTLNYNLDINKHGIKILGGYSQIFNSASNLGAFRNTFYNNEIQAISAGASSSKDNNGNDVTSGLRSYFASLNYNFSDKYLFEVNGRYDGSSKFTGDNLYSFFPSFSAGWRISQEKFWQPLSGVIQDIKLRGSWGKTGNQTVDNYTFYDAINTRNYNYGGAASTGYAALDYANTGIKWETTRQTDIGLDMSFLNSKLNVTVDYYDKLTSGILLNLPIAGVIGLNAPIQNAGVVSNKGWEFGLDYNNMDNAFKYSMNFNISNNKNEVLDLKGTGPYITGSSLDGLYATNVGMPINVLWGFKTDGYYKDANDVAKSAKYDPNTFPGDLKYVDLDGDGKITAADRANLGDEFPHYTFGLVSNLQYKNFDFYISVQGAIQQKARISGAIIAAGANESFVIDLANDYWTPDNTDARYPRPQKNTEKNTQISDHWVVEMGYARIKALQLGYTFPKSVTDFLKIRKLRMYVSGTNLFTVSQANKWGLDPEFPTGRLSYYPQTKVYTFGVNVNF